MSQRNTLEISLTVMSSIPSSREKKVKLIMLFNYLDYDLAT